MITPDQLTTIQSMVDKGLLRVEDAEDAIALLLANKDEEAVLCLEAALHKGGKLTFRQFIEKVDRSFVFHRHTDHIIEQLQLVADGKLRRLMIWMPPRAGKSYLVSQLFPAYYIYLYPEKFVGVASYSADLAGEFSRVAREFYKEALELAIPGVAPLALEGQKRWGTTLGGGVWAVGRGGSCTGKGGDILILDDPLKDAQEAASPTILKQLEQWFQSVFWTRQQRGGKAAVIICQTRWNAREISSKILADEISGKTKEGWTIVKLEAVKQAKDTQKWPKNATIVPDWRKPGEALCPEIAPLDELRSIKSIIGEYYWAALYQQEPKAGDGTVFRAPDFQRYDEYTMPQRFDRIICSWDCTFEDETSSDYVVGTVLGQIGARVYLLDRVRGQWDFPTTIMAFINLLKRWPQITARVVEKKANGHALIQSLRRSIPGIVAWKPGSASKYTRAMAVQHYVAAGNIFIPADDKCPWVEEWLDEITAFPVGKHDDQVDSFVQGLSFLAASPLNPGLMNSNAEWGRQDPLQAAAEAARLAGIEAIPERYKLTASPFN